MFGIGIVIIFVVLSLGLGYKHNGLSLPQISFGVLLGLLLASISPNMATASHQFINAIGNDIINIHWSN